MAFVDHGEFEAMKTLVGYRAPHCVKDQFCAKMTSTSTVCEILLLNIVVITRRMRKMATPHFCIYLSFVWLLATCMSLADDKATQRGSLGAQISF